MRFLAWLLRLCPWPAIEQEAFRRGYPMVIVHELTSCPVYEDPDAYGLHTPQDGCEMDQAWTEEVLQDLHQQAGHWAMYVENCREDPCADVVLPV